MKRYTPLENAMRTIHFQKPDEIVGGIPSYWISYFGCDHQGDDGNEWGPVGTTWTDIFGVKWQKEQEGVMGLVVKNPIPTPDALKSYQWPDPDDPKYIHQIYEQAKGYDPASGTLLRGSHRDTLWEKAYMLVGMEDLMVYFYTEPEFAREVLQHIMDFQLGIAKHYIACGVKIASLGDDLGTQNGLLISPAIIEEFLMPQYRRLFDFYQQHDVFIQFHSCGCIDKAIPFFTELGVDILEPVQATANDLSLVRQLTQGKITLQGGVSSGLIMDGTPEEIRQAVFDAIDLLGRDGGYFCTPDQAMPFPEENIAAFWNAVDEYNRTRM